MSIDPELLAIMRCPDCHGPLHEEDDPPALACDDCGLHYPVREGIPVMLEEEAYRPDEDA
jgi:uncharacterized protein YbaR (Trm112 family)